MIKVCAKKREESKYKYNFEEVEDSSNFEQNPYRSLFSNPEIEQPRTFNSISNDEDILQMYLKDVGRVKMISFSEEKRLGKLIREGSKNSAEIAKRKLVQD